MQLWVHAAIARPGRKALTSRLLASSQSTSQCFSSNARWLPRLAPTWPWHPPHECERASYCCRYHASHIRVRLGLHHRQVMLVLIRTSCMSCFRQHMHASKSCVLMRVSFVVASMTKQQDSWQMVALASWTYSIRKTFMAAVCSWLWSNHLPAVLSWLHQAWLFMYGSMRADTCASSEVAQQHLHQ